MLANKDGLGKPSADGWVDVGCCSFPDAALSRHRQATNYATTWWRQMEQSRWVFLPPTMSLGGERGNHHRNDWWWQSASERERETLSKQAKALGFTIIGS